MAFRFRQFEINDLESTMRVGTDSMLLGAWADPGDAARILDVGTGCGILALMMAQKSEAAIDAVEIDEPSARQALENFRHSPWGNRINLIRGSFQEFSSGSTGSYDFIISNPPYFTSSLTSHVPRKNLARHDRSLNLQDLAKGVATTLKPGGRFAVILPFQALEAATRLSASHNLHPRRCTCVHPKPGAPARRVLLEFLKDEIKPVECVDLTILDESGKFSAAYLTLTSEFHLF
jgi:tRNA1Val (adenine37-N6)-methyltransferase